MATEYLPVFLQIAAAVFFAVAAIGVSLLLGQRGRRTRAKDMPYECGKDPIGPMPRFSVKFYMVAMLFILFDVETVFFILWGVVYRDQLQNGLGILFAMLFFTAILFVGLAYELKKKALDWAR
jgi:NADH-quinone oxidoreductase subunit A